MNRLIESKLGFYIGVLIYIAALIIGAIDYVTISLLLFLVSYLVLLLWSVHYKADQLSKGLGLILLGSGFVGILGFSIGLSGALGSIKPLLVIPDNLLLTYSILMAMAGSSFTGAGGSILANVATKDVNDNIETKNNVIESKELKSLKGDVELILKLLIIIIVLSFFGLMIALFLN